MKLFITLTTFIRLDHFINIYLDIKELTPAQDGQLIPGKGDHVEWLFLLIYILSIFAPQKIILG
jgi:hypothetical protein